MAGLRTTSGLGRPTAAAVAKKAYQSLDAEQTAKPHRYAVSATARPKWPQLLKGAKGSTHTGNNASNIYTQYLKQCNRQ